MTANTLGTKMDFTLAERDDYEGCYPRKSINIQVVDVPEGRSIFFSILTEHKAVAIIELDYQKFLTAYAGALNQSVYDVDIDALINQINQEDKHD